MNRLKFGTYKQQVSFRKEIIEIEDHIPNKPTKRKNIDKKQQQTNALLQTFPVKKESS